MTAFMSAIETGVRVDAPIMQVADGLEGRRREADIEARPALLVPLSWRVRSPEFIDAAVARGS